MGFLYRKGRKMFEETMKQNVTEDQFRLMVEGLTSDMIERLVEREHYSLKEAIDVVYGSDTYAALTRAKTGLYNQSTGYVMQYLMHEIRTGKMA